MTTFSSTNTAEASVFPSSREYLGFDRNVTSPACALLIPATPWTSPFSPPSNLQPNRAASSPSFMSLSPRKFGSADYEIQAALSLTLHHSRAWPKLERRKGRRVQSLKS